ISGWDLVGALPLSEDQVAHLMADADTRWLQRGAYDLLGVSTEQASAAGLPRAAALYGPLPAQLEDPRSFASRLREILHVRTRYRFCDARALDVPSVPAPGLLVMPHELPDGGLAITALNFGRDDVAEQVTIPAATRRTLLDAFDDGQQQIGADGAV